MVIFNNKAFSLIELLVTVVIVSILVTVGSKFYIEHREKNYITTAQAELVNVLQHVKIAKQTDGWYHQFLYQMGYAPKGLLTSIVGTGAISSAPCCSGANGYPSLGSTPCRKSIGSDQIYRIRRNESCSMGFICVSGCKFGKCNPTLPNTTCNCEGDKAFETYTYYNCRNDSLNTATNNKLICDDSAYQNQSQKDICDTTKLPSSFPSFTKCTPNPSGWCNCNSFMIGAASDSFEYEVTLNHENKLCAKK